jgi:hypothetical protein
MWTKLHKQRDLVVEDLALHDPPRGVVVQDLAEGQLESPAGRWEIPEWPVISAGPDEPRNRVVAVVDVPGLRHPRRRRRR